MPRCSSSPERKGGQTLARICFGSMLRLGSQGLEVSGWPRKHEKEDRMVAMLGLREVEHREQVLGSLKSSQPK